MSFAETVSAKFYKMSFEGRPSVVKSFKDGFEQDFKNSTLALESFDGQGMVKLLSHSGKKQVLEWVEGETLLRHFHIHGDASAAKIFCEVLKKMHFSLSPIGLVPTRQVMSKMELPNLSELFKAILKDHALWVTDEELWRSIESTAAHLITSETGPRILHGDLHHENIAYSPERGWLALDPKGVFAEITYELSNFFYNPTKQVEVVAAYDRIKGLAQIFSKFFEVDEKRILQFALVHGGVSALWSLEDGEDPRARLHIANQIHRLIR